MGLLLCTREGHPLHCRFMHPVANRQIWFTFCSIKWLNLHILRKLISFSGTIYSSAKGISRLRERPYPHFRFCIQLGATGSDIDLAKRNNNLHFATNWFILCGQFVTLNNKNILCRLVFINLIHLVVIANLIQQHVKESGWIWGKLIILTTHSERFNPIDGWWPLRQNSQSLDGVGSYK